jgi:hypothetical protein
MTALNYTDIKQYLLSLTKPQQLLDGNAICPFIQKYFDDISYTQHGSVESVLALIPKVVKTLIIAQRQSILREARKRLAKTTNYYDHWQAIDK